MSGDDVQGSIEPGSRGLNRRQMIKASALAGAAAWTAPVIIDSLASPAAAASCGDRWYMKLVGVNGSGTPGDCYNQPPFCNNTTDYLTGGNTPNNSTCSSNGGYTWVCATNPPQKFRSSFVDNGSSYTITLASGCTFSNDTNYRTVGNYNFTSGGGTCYAITTTIGSNSVTVPKTQGSGSGTQTLSYMYFEFVCS